ncbi:MAG: hypothetical protein KGH93_01695 [Patescibacteria group bacterium]|nr:hypothetical protein [Patescibacteria group bacterium]
MKSQMKGLPPEQQARILAAMNKDPQFFEDLGKQIDRKVKEGKGKVEASMQVMRENQDKLRKLMM